MMLIMRWRSFFDSRQAVLSGGTLGLLLSVSSALAGGWNEEPQPLVFKKAVGADPLTAIRADAGSPLAWDQSAHMLWFVDFGTLHAAWWNGSTFVSADMGLIAPLPEAGIVIDSSTHFVYCVSADGFPHCARLIGKKWVIRKIGDKPVTRLLGVDQARHRLFAYDANAAGIRLYQFDAKTKSWPSSIIASGLGAAGDLGAFDAASQTLYTTHETAEPGIQRHPDAQTIADPTGFGKLKPWPLVATAWNGTAWSSRLLGDTGVPQQPAVRPLDHRLFFASRDDLKTVRFYQPAYRKAADAFGSETGWSGRDTWRDDDSYKIVEPKYPRAWISGLFLSSYSLSFLSDAAMIFSGTTRYTVKLTSPVVPVPYYAPIWTDLPLAPRLAGFRALINPRQSRLVQHREWFEGEIARSQTGMQIVGYLYRDATGLLVTECAADPANGPQLDSDLRQPRFYPALDAGFDPLSAPADFARLSDSEIFADPNDIVADPMHRNPVKSTAIPGSYTTNAASPLVPPHLRLPSSVQLRTFGHRYSLGKLDQPGSRFRAYSNAGTDYAMASHIAIDTATGVTFYTQAPPPAGNENAVVPAEPQTTTPLANFTAPSDPKLPRPQGTRVWIVMVY
ncbi:MAG: hypothetical protein JWL90_4515 [Chthoniobacteraceae bacterium]|nr:hypothetical protein [Chthoniobacteraceae bacterium]